ncbi:MAG: hypothetical protein ACTSRW_00645 [Candidatus Helarchaeota archaeon]
MADEELTIAEATRRVIQTRPSLIDAMKQEVINFSALAERLKREVQTLVQRNKKINVEAIKMALMRHSKELTEKWIILEKQLAGILGQSKLELKNDLMVLTIRQIALLDPNIELTKLMNDTDFFQLIQGTTFFSIIADADHEQRLIKLLNKRNILKVKREQSALILKCPDTIADAPGIVAYVTNLFAQSNINITEFLSCHTDTIFVIDRKLGRQAYQILEDQILLFRSLLSSE